MFRRTLVAVLMMSLVVVAAGCGDDDEPAGESGTTQPEATCPSELPLKESGTLTVATGEPVFDPWMIDDDPTNGKGFESAVIYAVADQLGIDKADVKWTRTGFDEAVAPGDKDYDFNIQQFGDHPRAGQGRRLLRRLLHGGAGDRRPVRLRTSPTPPRSRTSRATGSARPSARPASTTSRRSSSPTPRPRFTTTTPPPRPPSTPTRSTASCSTCRPRYYVTSAEIEGSSIVGVLPTQGDDEELGMLFETDSPLIPCVNEALATLKDDGTLADLQEEWLSKGGDIPTLKG